jgi:hypothetical protein
VRDEAFAILMAGEEARASGKGCHVSFVALTRAAAEEFHASALRLGGTDDGAPGPRPHFGPGYYAAFVVDPDGYRVEAVLHEDNVSSPPR